MIDRGKWIKDSHPEQPVTEVARQAVRQRLRVVSHFLRLAAKEPDADIENVHQLRVATRRARAALEIFGRSLPSRRVAWFQKHLRRVRRTAGDARDLDVLGQRLKKIARQNAESDLARVLVQIKAQRKKAQKPLVKCYKQLKQKALKRRSKQLVDRVRWRGDGDEPCFGRCACDVLSPLVDEFFTAASADVSDIDALHKMRILGKQLRYGMELLAGAFDQSFRDELYPSFEEVQEKIGSIIDHQTAAQLFDQWMSKASERAASGELARLKADEEKQLHETAREFQQWWTHERGAGLRRRFTELGVDSTGQLARSTDAQEGSCAG